jgi:hypothetical protein
MLSLSLTRLNNAYLRPDSLAAISGHHKLSNILTPLPPYPEIALLLPEDIFNLVIVRMYHVTIEDRLRLGFSLIDNDVTGIELLEEFGQAKMKAGDNGKESRLQVTMKKLKGKSEGSHLMGKASEFFRKIVSMGVSEMYKIKEVDVIRPIDMNVMSKINVALSVSLDPTDVEINQKKKNLMQKKIAEPTLTDLKKVHSELEKVLESERKRSGGNVEKKKEMIVEHPTLEDLRRMKKSIVEDCT